MTPSNVIEAALAIRTLEDAERVQGLIERLAGGRYERPLGDTWKNIGLISRPGSVDHKIIEAVTNMQDAVIERLALEEYGDAAHVPFDNPREAADALLGTRDYKEIADDVSVTFYESDPPTSRTRRLTAVFRDGGCGMTADEMPETIFMLGASRKDDMPYLQGAFGMGGKTAFRHAQAVVVVSRKAPSLLAEGEEDRVSAAVLLWTQHTKTDSLYYLVEEPWERRGDVARPISVPADQVPGFEPGTYLALVSLHVEGYHRQRLGDERTFDTVLNTRLFRPTTPVKFRNEMLGRDRSEYLRGLERRLMDNPREDRLEGHEVLPIHLDGSTYHLPITFYVFAKRGEAGERRKFVAHDHAVVLTSNGQVHKHWSPREFKAKTQLTQLDDRILVIVDTDELPIRVRTGLFTPDRSETVGSDQSEALEQAVAGFLNDWTELCDINGQLIREAIAGTDGMRSTIAVAQKIARALKMKGFGLFGKGEKGGGKSNGHRKRRPPEELYADPTTLEGPINATAETGKTKFLTYILNAEDSFDRRATITATCNHPEIGEREVTIGKLKNGFLRVSLAVPDGADEGNYELVVIVDEWLRSAGGPGSRLEWTTALEVVNQAAPKPKPKPGSGSKKGESGAGEGTLVAVVWKSHEEEDSWNASTVGDVLDVKASDLAAMRPDDYADLASLGDTRIPTVRLNEHYAPLKDYIAARKAAGVDAEPAKDRYATGVGVSLLLLKVERDKKAKKQEAVDEDMMATSAATAARGVLSVLPDFDRLAREAGLDESV